MAKHKNINRRDYKQKEKASEEEKKGNLEQSLKELRDYYNKNYHNR